MIRLLLRVDALRLRCLFRCLVTDATTANRISGTENEQRMRVRRARPADVPRVLRFVRCHARFAWPYITSAAPKSPTQLIVKDYVSRTLAQGHSMLAEQYEPRRGWDAIRGLALNAVVCPWDSALLERWARCVRCPQSRQFINLSAQCLREPNLFEKYKMKSIMQITLLVPPETSRCTEIIKILAKNSMQRGQDIGYSILRLDITNEEMVKALKDFQLRREWHLKTGLSKEQQDVVSVYTTPPIFASEIVK